MSQRAFVKKHDMGTPANLSQYLQGRRAVSLEVALKMSNALGVPVEDFSPRLANRINELHLDNNVEPVRHRMKLIPVLVPCNTDPQRDFTSRELPGAPELNLYPGIAPDIRTDEGVCKLIELFCITISGKRFVQGSLF